MEPRLGKRRVLLKRALWSREKKGGTNSLVYGCAEFELPTQTLQEMSEFRPCVRARDVNITSSLKIKPRINSMYPNLLKRGEKVFLFIYKVGLKSGKG